MGTPRAARALRQPLPLAGDVSVQTVGTTAAEVDLFSIFNVDRRLGAEFRVTLRARGDIYVLGLAATGDTAATSSTGVEMSSGDELSFEIDDDRGYLSALGASAGQRYEIVKG